MNVDNDRELTVRETTRRSIHLHRQTVLALIQESVRHLGQNGVEWRLRARREWIRCITNVAPGRNGRRTSKTKGLPIRDVPRTGVSARRSHHKTGSRVNKVRIDCGESRGSHNGKDRCKYCSSRCEHYLQSGKVGVCAVCFEVLVCFLFGVR